MINVSFHVPNTERARARAHGNKQEEVGKEGKGSEREARGEKERKT